MLTVSGFLVTFWFLAGKIIIQAEAAMRIRFLFVNGFGSTFFFFYFFIQFLTEKSKFSLNSNFSHGSNPDPHFSRQSDPDRTIPHIASSFIRWLYTDIAYPSRTKSVLRDLGQKMVLKCQNFKTKAFYNFSRLYHIKKT